MSRRSPWRSPSTPFADRAISGRALDHPAGRSGARRPAARRARAVPLVALAALLTWGAAPAAAEEQPGILKAYGLDWIERVRDDAWPQPKEQRPVICLLDTGVAVTPDTPADDPLGPIVARLAIDGGTGLPQGDLFEHTHGTQMASIIAAPRNGYGTVGVFPQARIVSVRVTEGDATYITPGGIALGTSRCAAWARGHGNPGIAAVSISEANYEQRGGDAPMWERAAAIAEADGGLFVAAAGNAVGAKEVAPAVVTEILTVMAGGPSRVLCGFARDAGEEAIVGPGCDENDANWPDGSSAATAAIAGLVAAIASGTTSHSAASTRAVVRSAMAGSGDPRSIDARVVSQLFGEPVSEIVRSLNTPAPQAAPASAAPAVSVAAPSPPAPVAATKLWRPGVRASWRRGRLKIERYDRAGKGVIVTSVKANGLDLAAPSTSRSVTFSVARRPRSIEVWVRAKNGSWRSLSSRVRVFAE